MTLRDSFLFESQSRWLWISVVTIVVFTLLYLFDAPLGGRNGGTTLGLTAGCVAAAEMIFLMLYAKRKRAYSSTLGTLKNWLSAHIWIGASLLILVPIHSGFQFGMNVHTLCYIFILITIVTGVWGTYLCVSLPPTLEARREGLSVKGLIAEIQQLSVEIAQLSRGRSSAFMKIVNKVDFSLHSSVWQILSRNRGIRVSLNDQTLSADVQLLANEEQKQAIQLISLVDRKIELANKLYREVRILTLLKIWLYLHLPFAVGGMTLLVIHIFSVFYQY